jgi:hypothetical protein
MSLGPDNPPPEPPPREPTSLWGAVVDVLTWIGGVIISIVVPSAMAPRPPDRRDDGRPGASG